MRESQQYAACEGCGRGFKEDTMLPMKRMDLNNKEVKTAIRFTKTKTTSVRQLRVSLVSRMILLAHS
jgi:hypothetical protein